MSGSVGLEGSDGSWVILDVARGRINGVEIAVWPEVRKLPTLSPPTAVEDAHVVVPARRSQPNIASLEMNARSSPKRIRTSATSTFVSASRESARTIRLAPRSASRRRREEPDFGSLAAQRSTLSARDEL